MVAKKARTWIWIQNGHLFKAVVSPEMGCLTVYGDDGKVILKCTGLKKDQLEGLEVRISKSNKLQ